MLNFHVGNKAAMNTIFKIADRAHAMAKEAGHDRTKMDWVMDISAAHANGCPLRLTELLSADDFNFSHDVFGIAQHLDRETGQLGDCFVPRYASRITKAEVGKAFGALLDEMHEITGTPKREG